MKRALALAGLLLCSSPGLAQTVYQDSGRPWIDVGRTCYEEWCDQFADSRHLLQAWKVFPESEQVLYWTRFSYTPRHVAYLKKRDPYWGKPFDRRKPMGPYLVECGSETGKTSSVEMQPGWSSPVLTPIGEGFAWARIACSDAGFETNW